ncbi:MAG: UbiH/UbiF family hydroxylase [Stappiaceae bacterium]
MVKNKTNQKDFPNGDAPISHEVCIVGGGPSGLICALMMAKSGIDTALIAPCVTPDDGRTTALLQASLKILESLEIWPKLLEIAAPLKKMRLIDDTGRLLRAPETTFDSTELELDAFGYNLPNSEMVKALLSMVSEQERLATYDTVAEAVEPTGERATVSLKTGEAISCALVVGADGRNSTVREAAAIPVKKWKYEQHALVANLRHTVPHHDCSTEFHTPTGPFTLVPLKGNNSSLVCVVRLDTAEQLRSFDAGQLALELEKRAHSILGRFDLESAAQIFPLSGMTANRVGQNRCALIGESAHVFPPIGAQGLNLGLRDVAWLGETVVRAKTQGTDIGGTDTLSAYNDVRMNDIRSRTTAVDLLNRTLLTDFLPIQTGRSVGLYLAGRVGPLRRVMMREGIAPSLSSPKLARGVPLST